MISETRTEGISKDLLHITRIQDYKRHEATSTGGAKGVTMWKCLCHGGIVVHPLDSQSKGGGFESKLSTNVLCLSSPLVNG